MVDTYLFPEANRIDRRWRHEDNIPNYNHQDRSLRLLTVVIRRRVILSVQSIVWGGRLTSVNSVGERLVKELESQTRK